MSNNSRAIGLDMARQSSSSESCIRAGELRGYSVKKPLRAAGGGSLMFQLCIGEWSIKLIDLRNSIGLGPQVQDRERSGVRTEVIGELTRLKCIGCGHLYFAKVTMLVIISGKSLIENQIKEKDCIRPGVWHDMKMEVMWADLYDASRQKQTATA